MFIFVLDISYYSIFKIKYEYVCNSMMTITCLHKWIALLFDGGEGESSTITCVKIWTIWCCVAATVIPLYFHCQSDGNQLLAVYTFLLPVKFKLLLRLRPTLNVCNRIKVLCLWNSPDFRTREDTIFGICIKSWRLIQIFQPFILIFHIYVLCPVLHLPGKNNRSPK